MIFPSTTRADKDNISVGRLCRIRPKCVPRFLLTLLCCLEGFKKARVKLRTSRDQPVEKAARRSVILRLFILWQLVKHLVLLCRCSKEESAICQNVHDSIHSRSSVIDRTHFRSRGWGQTYCPVPCRLPASLSRWYPAATRPDRRRSDLYSAKRLDMGKTDRPDRQECWRRFWRR